ncbi:unnamed protein product [Rotaria sp. Silwood2]|nr:unnamed protein product [Rotaria sp. Silwood2]CAF3007860.1 unnamed protein product [Rotaria sp. Silwood2]CAF4067519.1 unnamed protein product [Rotaria sp. Silwood2]CAF4310390.1 unnamed protein product [Rotaria sp. Silwood2]CAF4738079.1 unnamed protein product [Rotaria sp. Silwood2]
MGCCSSTFSVYTVEEVEAEIANFAPRLPVAVLMNGGIIKLEGANGFFNPNSLLDASWLQGKLTPQEYYEAINYINKCTAHTHVGLSKIYLSSERPMREQLRVQAGTAAVQQINKQHPSVRFTYQQTAENMQINTSYSTDPVLRFAQRGKAPIGNASITMLYISVN